MLQTRLQLAQHLSSKCQFRKCESLLAFLMWLWVQSSESKHQSIAPRSIHPKGGKIGGAIMFLLGLLALGRILELSERQ